MTSEWHSFVRVVIVLILVIACQADFQVNTYTRDDQELPAIAADAQGNFVVVWRSARQDAGSRGIYGQRFDADGMPIGGEFKINTTSVGGRVHTGPSVAVDSSGNFVVVWTGYRGDEENIIARRYNASGLPITGEFSVNTRRHSAYENSHIGPAVAMNGSGAFVVVWEAWHGDDAHNGNWAVYGRAYDSRGAPQADEFMVTQLPHGRLPDAVMDESGDFVVTWFRSGDSDDLPMGESIRFRRYRADSTPKGDAVQITDRAGPATDYVNPSIVMDENGSFVIAWGALNPSTEGQYPYDIYAQQFDPNGTPISTPWVCNTYTDDIQCRPSVAMNLEGQFIIVWASRNQDASDFGIFGQKYDSDGTKIGGEFQINTYTPDRQWKPDITMSQDGRFITVWQGGGQDGSGYGIFGRLGPIVGSADCNGDGCVNFLDYCTLAAEWEKEENRLEADLIDDNRIDAQDLAAFCQQWLTGP